MRFTCVHVPPGRRVPCLYGYARAGSRFLPSRVQRKLLLKLNAGFRDPTLPELFGPSGYARRKDVGRRRLRSRRLRAAGRFFVRSLRLNASSDGAATMATPDDVMSESGYDGYASARIANDERETSKKKSRNQYTPNPTHPPRAVSEQPRTQTHGGGEGLQKPEIG